MQSKRKILAHITSQEKDTCIMFNALKATYETLLKINDYELDKAKIQRQLSECKQRLDDYWLKITIKYHIPLYVDKPLIIDNEKLTIYIKEE